MSSEAGISHVSDTALMVAAARALETARADGLVRDPFAERLAGDRGMAILRNLPRAAMMCFGIGIRSRFIDELVLELVASGNVTTVLSLGSGLDTRPWRLELPSGLRWVEADFPEMLNYKHSRMAEDKPRCRLEGIAADLASAPERAAVFAHADPGRTLLITEGLLMYLAGETVEALAVESAQAGIAYWIVDIASPDFTKRVSGTDASIQKVRAANHLDGLQTLEVLRRHGWSGLRHRNFQGDVLACAPERVAEILNERAAAGAPVTAPAPDDPSGVHVFGIGA
jgi:methyltransferase (TIGR00027 family)